MLALGSYPEVPNQQSPPGPLTGLESRQGSDPEKDAETLQTTGRAPPGEGIPRMGRASRTKHERRHVRTITVRNTLTGMLETFHDVRVNDAAVADWLADRWISVSAGNPNRPPDYDSATFRGWIWRDGDPDREDGLAARGDDLVAFYRAESEPVRLVSGEGKGFVDRDALPDTFQWIAAAAMAKGKVVRAEGGFTGHAWLQLEFVGNVEREEAHFATEAEARAWVVATLGKLSAGGRVEEWCTSSHA